MVKISAAKLREIRIALENGVITKDVFIRLAEAEPREFKREVESAYKKEKREMIENFIDCEYFHIVPCTTKECYEAYIGMEEDIPDLYKTRRHQFGILMGERGIKSKIAYFDGKTQRVYL
jgi:hypothetical protein